MTLPVEVKKMGLNKKVDVLAKTGWPEAVGVPITDATVTVKEYGTGPIHKTIFTCTATPVTITDVAGTCQYGGITTALYTFPQGLICYLGSVIDGAVTLGVTGTITATWSGLVSLGTVTAAGDATLTATEANLLQSTAVAAAVAKVATVDAISIATALTESGATWVDGTGTASALFLNLIVTDEATHTSGTGTFTGTVTITWINCGDK